MNNKNVESINLRINQKEKDIDDINEAIKKLNKDIPTLYDRINETKDEKELIKLQKQADGLQKQADGLQKQADGLREDRTSLETQLSNLENKKRGREEQFEPSKKLKVDFFEKYNITKQDLDGEDKASLLDKFCLSKDLKIFTIQVRLQTQFTLEPLSGRNTFFKSKKRRRRRD